MVASLPVAGQQRREVRLGRQDGGARRQILLSHQVAPAGGAAAQAACCADEVFCVPIADDSLATHLKLTSYPKSFPDPEQTRANGAVERRALCAGSHARQRGLQCSTHSHHVQVFCTQHF